MRKRMREGRKEGRKEGGRGKGEGNLVFVDGCRQHEGGTTTERRRGKRVRKREREGDEREKNLSSVTKGSAP